MKKIAIGLLATLSLWGADRAKIFWDLETGIEAYRYEEKSVMMISGPMYRVDTILGLLIDLFKIQLEGYYSRDLNRNVYNGSLFVVNNGKTTKTPYSTKSTDWYAGGNLKLGYSLQQVGNSFVYVGFGYRFLRNHVVDKPGVKGAYQRDQSYLYIPAGIDVEIPVTDNLSFISMIEHRFFLRGKNRSAFSELGYDSDLFFTQKEGLGGRVAVGVNLRYAKAEMRISLYYDYWFVENSDRQPLYKNGASNLTFIEPKNNTKAIGLMAGISF